jgi:hypothetical protein
MLQKSQRWETTIHTRQKYYNNPSTNTSNSNSATCQGTIEYGQVVFIPGMHENFYNRNHSM